MTAPTDARCTCKNSWRYVLIMITVWMCLVLWRDWSVGCSYGPGEGWSNPPDSTVPVHSSVPVRDRFLYVLPPLCPAGRHVGSNCQHGQPDGRHSHGRRYDPRVTLWALLRWILTDDCLANSLTETESVSSSEHFSLLLYLTYWTTVAIAAPTSCSLQLFQLQLIVILILYYNNNNRTIIIVSSRNIFP